jgi:AbrB family looped-hinge helix DNA binding protein
MITTVTGKNQITIPAKIARALDIRPGSRFDWSISDEGTLIVHLLPHRSEMAQAAAGMGRAWLPDGVDPVDDLLRERTKDAANENDE